MYMPTFPLTVRVPRVRSSFVGHSIIPISYPRNRALPVWAWVISVFSADRVSFSSVARNVDILSLIWWASTKGPANPRRKSSAYLTYRNLLYSPFAQSTFHILNFKLAVEMSTQPQPLQDGFLHP